MSADYIVDMRNLPGCPSNGADGLQHDEEVEESSDFRNFNLVDIEQDEDSADNSESQNSSVSETEEDEEHDEDEDSVDNSDSHSISETEEDEECDDDRPNGKDLCEFCTLFFVLLRGTVCRFYVADSTAINIEDSCQIMLHIMVRVYMDRRAYISSLLSQVHRKVKHMDWT